MTESNKLHKLFVYYSAWGVIGGVLAIFASVLIGGREIVQIQSLANPIIYALALLQVLNLVYPIAILWLGVKEKNYKFLKSPLHYIAIPLSLFMWFSALM